MNTSMYTATKCAYLLQKQGKALFSHYETKAMIVQLIALIHTLEETGSIILRHKDPWQRSHIIPTDEKTAWSAFCPTEAMEVVDFIEQWTATDAEHASVRHFLEQDISTNQDDLEAYAQKLQNAESKDPFVLALLDSGQCFSALFHAPIQHYHVESFDNLTEEKETCIDAVPLLWMLRYVR